MNLELNYEGFATYLVSMEPNLRGIQYIFKFPNNYGASVIKHEYSCGHDLDLWELAVIWWRDGEWELDSSTDITDDIVGCQTDEEIRDLLRQIKEL